MLCPKWNRPWQKKIEATIRSECELSHKFAWKHSRFQTWQHTAASTQKRSPPTNSFIAANQWRIQKSLQVTRTEKNRNSKDDSLNPTNDARLFHSPWHHAPMDQDRQTEHAKNVDAKYHDSHTHDPSKPFINSDVKRLGHEDTSRADPRRNWREGTKQKIASLLRRIKDLCPSPDYLICEKQVELTYPGPCRLLVVSSTSSDTSICTQYSAQTQSRDRPFLLQKGFMQANWGWTTFAPNTVLQMHWTPAPCHVSDDSDATKSCALPLWPDWHSPS